MGFFDAVWQSSVEILKDATSKAGAIAARRQLESARDALRNGDPTTARNIAETLTDIGDIVGRSAPMAPLIGAAHGVAGRARRTLGDDEGAQQSAARAVAAFERAADSELKLDGAELSEWGLALVELGDARGVEVLTRAVELGGATPEAYLRLAIESRSRDQLDDAEGFLRDALAIVPDDPTANGELGDILASVGSHDDAAYHLSIAGFEHGRRGNLDAAQSLLERSCVLAPNEPAALLALSEVHRAKGDLVRALDLVEASRSLDPSIVTTHFHAGAIRLELGEPEAALEAFERGLVLEPTNGYGLAGATRALWEAGRFDEAEARARRAVEAGSADPATTAIAAMAFEHDHDEHEAIRLYTTALELDGDLAFARHQLVQLLIAQTEELLSRDELDEAIVVADRALDADPNSPIAHANKARALSRSRRWAEALSEADGAVGLDREYTWAHVARAEALHGLGELDEAIAAAKRATETAASNSDVWLFLGDLQTEQSDTAAAAAYQTALDRDPENRAALIHLSEALDRLGRDEEAVPALEEYVRLHPDDAEILRHMGIRLFWANRDDESLEVLTRSLRLDPAQLDARLHIGLAHVSLANWSDAEAWLQPLVNVEDRATQGYARASLAFALMALEQHSRAAPLTRSVVDVLPEFAFGWQIRARLLNESGWFGEAADAARQAIELKPEVSWPYYSRAWAIERSGEAGKAVDAWSAAERMAPDDLWAIKGLANALAGAGEPTLAQEKYGYVLAALDAKAREGREAGISLDSDDLALAGWCRMCIGDSADAVKLLISSVVARQDPAVQFDLALAMLGAGQPKQALRQYERGVEWLDSCDPLRRRGLLLVALGDLDRLAPRRDDRASDIASQCASGLRSNLELYQQLHPDRLVAERQDGSVSDA